jgi:hypothetical protein
METPDLAKLKRYFTESEQLTQVARRKSLQALDYYDSDQFTAAELADLELRRQPAIVINRIKAAINGIIGVTERGTSDPRCWPRNPPNDDSADAATDVLRYIADFNRFKRLKQDCFRDMLVPGTMAALVGVDPDTQVTITQIRWEEHFYDPRSRRNDFKDARYQGIAKWMYQDDAATLYPDKAKDIEATVDNGLGGGIMPDESYQDRPLAGPGVGGAWVDQKQRRLMVVEMYYKQAGAWKRCVFTAQDVLEHGPSPYHDHKGRPDCPIEAMSAYVRRDNGRYGAVWDMIGPQDEINRRRSKSLHLISTTRIEVKDPQAIEVEADLARREAARPDGVIPYGWGLAPNTAEFQGNVEMLAEAKAEIERMGPHPAVLGRGGEDNSGRALLARQQSGLVELANLYGALEDWELRVYRQCWARAKQFWRAPQFIRVTDDEDAPKFVGLNQPQVHPMTGEVLGYTNNLGEMDVDIEIDTQQDTGNIQQEAFNEILELVKMSPVYQQQVSLATLIQLSPIPHKRAVLDQIKQAAAAQQRKAAQAETLAQAHAQAQLENTQADTQSKAAAGFAKASDALTYAHSVHADAVAQGVEKGIDSVGAEPSQAHEAAMATSAQAASANEAQADQPGPDPSGQPAQ